MPLLSKMDHNYRLDSRTDRGRRDSERRWQHKHDRSRSHSPHNSAAKRLILGSLSKSTRERSRERSNDKHKHKKSKREKKSKSKKKKRSRHHSSTSEDTDDSDYSADSDSSTELLMRLEKERLELKDKRKRDKEGLKALETPEEKRARRLMKKERKALKDKEKMGWDKDYVHYTNEDNPFGDHNLLQNFRWNQKLKQEGLDKLDERELHKIQRVKQEEQRQELEKVCMFATRQILDLMHFEYTMLIIVLDLEYFTYIFR